MEQENALADANAAPNAGETASPAEAPVSGGEQPKQAETVEAPKPRVFTQDELNAEIGKRLAKAERKWQRERDQAIAEAVAKTTRPQEPAKPAASEKPNPDSFKTTEEYLEALTDWKVDQRVKAEAESREKAQRETRRNEEAAQLSAEYRKREEAAKSKYDDFEDVVYDPRLPITDAMLATIQQSDSGAELAYYLGKNPEEAARIARLSPFLQAKELGRLEAKLPSEPPAKKTSSAPAPIAPVKPKGDGGHVDTTDPKSLEKLGTSAWIEAERQRQRREWEARNR